MAEFVKTTLELDHRFDKNTKRHYINNNLSVLHCHHYTTLYSQLAIDAKETKLLQDSAEDTFYSMLKNYFEKKNVTRLDDRIDIGCQYYAAIGMGKMAVNMMGDFSGIVTLERSHIDEGWIKKWKKFDAPVNFVTAGYIAAFFSAAQDKAPGTYDVRETESIVMGAKQSKFHVTRK